MQPKTVWTKPFILLQSADWSANLHYMYKTRLVMRLNLLARFLLRWFQANSWTRVPPSSCQFDAAAPWGGDYALGPSFPIYSKWINQDNYSHTSSSNELRKAVQRAHPHLKLTSRARMISVPSARLSWRSSTYLPEALRYWFIQLMYLSSAVRSPRDEDFAMGILTPTCEWSIQRYCISDRKCNTE